MVSYEYQVGGSLQLNAPSYIPRQADFELYEALVNGEFCYVFNARQMGKSSLRVQMWHRLRQAGNHCAVLDLTSIGSNYLTPQQWYKSLAADLLRGFDLWSQVNFRDWWQKHEGMAPLQCLGLLIEEVIFVQLPDASLFIFLDEVDSVLSLEFSTDDFFAFIRYCYNQRSINPAYNRLTWILFGVTSPSDLIRDRVRTPFNIGQAIELHGFQPQEVTPLLPGLIGKVAEPEQVLQEILTWTGGQPFLTQKLCHLVEKYRSSQPISSPSPTHLSPAHLSPAHLIEHIVRSQMIEHWETQDQPEHFRTIRDRLLRHDSLAVRVLGIYQQVLAGQSIAVDDSQEQVKLRLSGLVEPHQGRLRVKNRIYQAIFNADWVSAQLTKLRPYAEQFQAWIAANQPEHLHLLTGVSLQDALHWSADKMLSELDYRFLSASQILDKQVVEQALALEKTEHEQAAFALQAAQAANQILAETRQLARSMTQTLRLGRRWVLSIAVGVTLFVLLLRWTGWLQMAEWTALDQFFQVRPAAPIDERIVIVSIDEADLQKIGQFPVPDRVLSQVIETLKRHQARLIGLDIYRDLPIEPGHGEFVNLLQSTPNLIGIDQVVNQQIAPPPTLPLDRVGFADQILDGDGTVRRALLMIRDGQRQHRLSFSFKLALAYLKQQGITLRSQPTSGLLQLGKATLVPLHNHDGDYARATGGGYQILLNFYGTEQQFRIISISELLADRFPSLFLRDRIVLVGYTAESVDAPFQTPYSTQNSTHNSTKRTGVPVQMSGVVLQANMVSQLLSAALQGRPLLRHWSELGEMLWISLWIGLGTGLGWRFHTPERVIVSVLLALLLLLSLTYLLFLQGWWVSLIPPAIGLVLTGILLPSLSIRQAENLQLRKILQLLQPIVAQDPAVGGIAIEYLKQSETAEHQRLIAAWMKRHL